MPATGKVFPRQVGTKQAFLANQEKQTKGIKTDHIRYAAYGGPAASKDQTGVPGKQKKANQRDKNRPRPLCQPQKAL